MKKLLIFSILIFLSSIGFAQQEPLFANYRQTGVLFNPAIGGSEKNHEIRLFHRWQWLKFPGAPQTYGLSYSGGKKRIGIGSYIFMDITGPTRRWGGQLSYAYHLPLGETYKLGIGLGGRFVRYEVRTNSIAFQELNDEAVMKAEEGDNTGEAIAGLHFYSDRLYVSGALVNAIQTKLDFGQPVQGLDPYGRFYRHLIAMAGYKIDAKSVQIEPSLLLRMTFNTPPQVEGGIMFYFEQEQLGLGIAYRTPGFISFGFKATFDDKFPLYFAFDLATTQFKQYAGGSMETMIGANLMRKEFMGADPDILPIQPER